MTPDEILRYADSLDLANHDGLETAIALRQLAEEYRLMRDTAKVLSDTIIKEVPSAAAHDKKGRRHITVTWVGATAQATTGGIQWQPAGPGKWSVTSFGPFPLVTEENPFLEDESQPGQVARDSLAHVLIKQANRLHDSQQAQEPGT